MASLVSMTSKVMKSNLHKNTKVKVTEKAFSSINTLHLLRKSKFHCNLVLTRNSSRTLENTKIKFKAEHEHATTRISKEVQLGVGGTEGGIKENGGDDDNYFHHFNNGNDNDDRFGVCNKALENLDTNFVQVVLQKWGTTIQSLPNEICQAEEMKTISSAHMVEILSTYGQPIVLFLKSVPRAFMGIILADRSFLHKLLFNAMVTIACILWKELKHKRDMKEEWDIVVVKILTAIVSTTCMTWSLAPTQSYNSIFKFGFRNALHKLPNCVIGNSFSHQKFGMAKRVLSLVHKVGELSLIGLMIGVLASVMPLPRGKNVSALVFSMCRRAWALGVFLGLIGHLKYRVFLGMERLMQDHVEHLGIALFISGILRAFNAQIGDAGHHSKINIHRH